MSWSVTVTIIGVMAVVMAYGIAQEFAKAKQIEARRIRKGGPFGTTGTSWPAPTDALIPYDVLTRLGAFTEGGDTSGRKKEG